MKGTHRRTLALLAAVAALGATGAAPAGADTTIVCSDVATWTDDSGTDLVLAVGSIDESGCADGNVAGDLANCLATAMKQADPAARQEGIGECLDAALPEGWENESAVTDVVASAAAESADRTGVDAEAPDTGACGANVNPQLAEGGVAVGGTVQGAATAGVTVAPFVIVAGKRAGAYEEYLDAVATSDIQPTSDRLAKANDALVLTADAAQAANGVPSSTDRDGLFSWLAGVIAEAWNSLTGSSKPAAQPSGQTGSGEATRPGPETEACEFGTDDAGCKAASAPTELCDLLGRSMDPQCNPEVILTSPDGADACATEEFSAEEVELAVELARTGCLSLVNPSDGEESPCSDPAPAGTAATALENADVCGNPEAMTGDDQCLNAQLSGVVQELVDGHFGDGPQTGPGPVPPSEQP